MHEEVMVAGATNQHATNTMLCNCGADENNITLPQKVEQEIRNGNSSLVTGWWPGNKKHKALDKGELQYYYSNQETNVGDYHHDRGDDEDDDDEVGEGVVVFNSRAQTEIIVKPLQSLHHPYAGISIDWQAENCKIIPKPLQRQGNEQLELAKKNKFLSSIISILACKQFKQPTGQHPRCPQGEQQYPKQTQAHRHPHAHRHPQHPANSAGPMPSSSPPTLLIYQKNKCPAKDLIHLICILLMVLILPYGLLDWPQPVLAGCRDEPSRSCEIICRPGSIELDNEHTYYDPANNSHVNDTFFNASTIADLNSGSLSLASSLAGYDCTIRALVLLPDNDTYLTSLRRVVPILKVAEQYIHESGLLPPFIKFDWMAHDDKCDAAYAMVNVMDGIVKKCAHVIFGPTCDYCLAAVGRITKYFNSNGTPLITVGGFTYDFEIQKTSCADEFYMLLRTGMLSFETISELTINVMKRHKWSRSVFFYDKDGQRNVAGLHTCFLMMNSLGKQMRKEHMNFAQYQLNKNGNLTDEMVREIGNKHSGKC